MSAMRTNSRRRALPASLFSRRLSPIFFFFALVAFGATAFAFGQASAAPPQTGAPDTSQSAPASAPVPTLQSNVSEVSFDLIVRDRKGHPVPNLSASNFVVTDNGTPVALTSLRLDKPTPGSPRLMALLYDNLDPAMGKNARTLTDKILKLIPPGDFAFAVFYVNGRLRLMQPYTTDRALVERAVLSATGASGTNAIADSAIAEKNLFARGNLAADSPVAAADRETARSLGAALTESEKLANAQPFVDRRVSAGLAAISALARAGEKLPGRKVAIYFSGGIEDDSRALDLVKNAVGAANRGELSVYPIDLSTLGVEANEDLVVGLAMGSLRASGNLNPVAVTGPATGPPSLTAGQQQQVTDNSINLEVGEPSDGPGALGRLAGGTGGRYIPAQMNLTKQIRQLIDDADNLYVASYLPPIQGYDGSFRAIRVRPLEKGVYVRARAGYFALPPTDVGGLQPFEVPLLALLKQPQPPADFSFRSSVVQLGELPGGLTQELVVELPVSQLEAKQDANSGLFSLRASVLAQIVDSTGAVIEQFGQEFNRRGALDTLDAARNEALSFQRSFSAPPGTYTVKVAIADAIADKASVARSEFQLAAAKPEPFLSDLVLVRRFESNGNNGSSAAARATDDSLGDPLESANGEVVPNLDGAVRAGTKEVSLFFLIHPGPPALGKAAMEIRVSRGGHVIGHAPLAFREAADNGPITYFSTLGTRSMSPGEYQVAVRLTQGAQSFERTATIRIAGQAKPAGTEIASAGAAPNIGSATDHADAAPEISGADAAAAVSAALPALVVTPSAPGAAVESESETAQRLEQARKRALDYAAALPNFLCVETTSRSVDSSGKGQWKRQDTLAEQLTYRNRIESRKMLAVDGHEAHDEPDPTKGMVSHGEFGGILNAIFDPSAHAVFTWKQSGMVGGEHVDIYDYKIAAKDSSFSLTGDNNWQYNTAFHGVVSIDSATLGVRQLTAVADDLPKGFSIHASAMRVDYDYIAINGHDYLLPTRATIALLRRKHEGVLNEIQFRDYKRFGAKARMLPTQ
jgi:VWFA-related protein